MLGAQRNTESAKILQQIGEDLVFLDAKPIKIKKLHVLAALEVEQHKKRIFDASMTVPLLFLMAVRLGHDHAEDPGLLDHV